MRRFHGPWVLLLTAIVLGIGSVAAAQDWKGTAKITGTVLDEEGKGVKDATVKLRLDGQGPDLKTNRKGEFTASDLKGGQWDVTVEAPGFAIRHQTVQVADGAAAPPLQINVVKGETMKKELEEQVQKANQLMQAGKYADARAEYQRVLEAQPNQKQLHRAIAFSYESEGNHADAMKEIDLALADDPSNVELLELGADAAIKSGDMNRANGYLAKITDENLSDNEIILNLAISMINKQQPGEAVKLLDRVATKFPQSALPYFYRGMAKLRMQQNPEAKADLEKFVSLAKSDSPQLQQAKSLIEKIK